jgi:hypothetical protein
LKFKRAALTKKQKVSAAILLPACLLIVYGVGVATDLFSSPIFSAFFIFSYETAHTIAVYAAIAGAAVAAIACIFVFRKRLIGTFKPNPTLPMVAAAEKISQTPTATLPVVTKKVVVQKVEQKDPLPQNKPASESKPKENAPANPVDSEKNGKITCPNCKKEFTTPMLMMDYSGKEPKLARYCPYCNNKV